MRWGVEHARQHDLSTLRLLGSVGEPINPEAWLWYHQVIGGGRCPVVDTWWQTETGAIMISPLPGISVAKPGSANRPLPGIAAQIVDRKGNEVTGVGGGYLVLTRPWPGMLRGLYGDPERYTATYWSRFPGKYLTGDGCKRDEDGYFWLLGRVDDVMNVSGHRLSTIEIESALVADPRVAEAAVVGQKDPLTGEAIFAFVILKGDVEPTKSIGEELRQHVAKTISPIARPKHVLLTPDLPKTRSGKIMRRLLRDIANGRQLGDTTTLADASVVETIRTETGKDEEDQA
jgi:acetyl-CoA synthetase